MSTYPERNWKTSENVDTIGWSRELLENVCQNAAEFGSAAVMVVHQGRVVLDWGETGRKLNYHSMRKSLLSALIGIYVMLKLFKRCKPIILWSAILVVSFSGYTWASSLHEAAEAGNLEEVKRLIEEGEDINAQDVFRETPLHLAARRGHKDVVEYLISKGSEVNAKSIVRWTPLHTASFQGNKEVAELLISKGANINVIDKDGKTPLHHSAEQSHIDIAEILIFEGANIDTEDKDDRTPLYYAKVNGHKEVEEFLISKGANRFDTLVITNGRIIDGTGADPIEDGVVVIKGERILKIGSVSDLEIPAQVTVIDVAGRTIMPGIINAHTHRAASVLNREAFLEEGVTAVCDLGVPISQMEYFEEERGSDLKPVARGFKAGTMVTAPGGYPGPVYGFLLSYEVRGPDEARAAVDDLIDRGADFIKIALDKGRPQNPFPVLSLEEVEVIVAVAHSWGALVRAHVGYYTLLDIVLETGLDVVEHVPWPFRSEAEYTRFLEQGLDLEDLPKFNEKIVNLAKHGVIMVPTLEIIERLIQRSTLEPEQRQDLVGLVLEVMSRFRASGGIVALGNDFGNPGVPPGIPLREMELLLEAGFTPMEVIEAGTRTSAYVCGHGDELGTLEVGKLADVIIVDGDPLRDIKAMSRVVMVIKGGEIAYRSR